MVSSDPILQAQKNAWDAAHPDWAHSNLVMGGGPAPTQSSYPAPTNPFYPTNPGNIYAPQNPAKAPPPLVTDPYGNVISGGSKGSTPAWYPGYSGTPITNPGQSLTSGPVSGYSPVYGGVPSVPNPIATQGAAIGGNLGNLGGIGQLSQGLGGINAALGAQPFQANLPNYQGLLGQASANTLSNLQGNLPADVVRNIAQAGAERGVSTGSPGSPNANAAYLRALGLTSLGLQQTGQQQFGQLVGLTPTGPQFNPASLLVSPEQYQQAQAAQNIYGSAPIPSAANQNALGLLQAGIGRGQGATQPYGFPTQSASLVQDVMNKYAPFPGGTPSYGSAGTVNPNAQATTYSSQADEGDLLAELFGEGQYGQQTAQTDYGPYDTGYTGDPMQDYFTGLGDEFYDYGG